MRGPARTSPVTAASSTAIRTAPSARPRSCCASASASRNTAPPPSRRTASSRDGSSTASAPSGPTSWGRSSCTPLTARVLGLAENKLRFIVPPDIGGSFGIKTSIYPYIALIALASKHAGVPVKWIEDRREHLLASSSGTDRVAYREVAAEKDGTVIRIRFKWMGNVGGYIRSPEPGCSFRPTGNFVGPYRFQHLEVDASVVMTNKSLTGPNRGYACGHLYFETEGMMDRLAEKLGLDPVELRRRNLLPS